MATVVDEANIFQVSSKSRIARELSLEMTRERSRNAQLYLRSSADLFIMNIWRISLLGIHWNQIMVRCRGHDYMQSILPTDIAFDRASKLRDSVQSWTPSRIFPMVYMGRGYCNYAVLYI